MLPDTVHQLVACRSAIARANQSDSQRSQWMTDQKDRFLAALQRKDKAQADDRWRELLPEVQHWLNQDFKTGHIYTDLSK
jgi:DNA-binding FadR family transcriptional regulator